MKRPPNFETAIRALITIHYSNQLLTNRVGLRFVYRCFRCTPWTLQVHRVFLIRRNELFCKLLYYCPIIAVRTTQVFCMFLGNRNEFVSYILSGVGQQNVCYSWFGIFYENARIQTCLPMYKLHTCMYIFM